MSWSNFNIPPTISELAVDERLQQQNGINEHSADQDEDSDGAAATDSDTIRALHESKLEPLMLSVSHFSFGLKGMDLLVSLLFNQMLEQRDKLQEQVFTAIKLAQLILLPVQVGENAKADRGGGSSIPRGRQGEGVAEEAAGDDAERHAIGL